MYVCYMEERKTKTASLPSGGMRFGATVWFDSAAHRRNGSDCSGRRLLGYGRTEPARLRTCGGCINCGDVCEGKGSAAKAAPTAAEAAPQELANKVVKTIPLASCRSSTAATPFINLELLMAMLGAFFSSSKVVCSNTSIAAFWGGITDSVAPLSTASWKKVKRGNPKRRDGDLRHFWGPCVPYPWLAPPQCGYQFVFFFSSFWRGVLLHRGWWWCVFNYQTCPNEAFLRPVCTPSMAAPPV